MIKGVVITLALTAFLRITRFCNFIFYLIDPVNYIHVTNSLPYYKQTVDVVELKGKDLRKVFEQVASVYDKDKPSKSFLQVSGITTFRINRDKQCQPYKSKQPNKVLVKQSLSPTNLTYHHSQIKKKSMSPIIV